MPLEAQPRQCGRHCARDYRANGSTVSLDETNIPGRDESERDKDDTPDTPLTEPPPVPVEDPPAEPGPQGPYVARD
jgi:hypothetical protein